MVGKRRGIGFPFVQTLFGTGTAGGLTDGELLGRFTDSRGEVAELAFAVLVERHGPMVLRVCRSVLRDEHDAEDAFQATFLVLAHRPAVRNRDSLVSWLYGVALRVSAYAKGSAARRRAHERRAVERAAAMPPRGDDRLDLEAVLHEEVGRLPERYRAAVVLCYLEGRTCEEAARQLGWPVGTVKSRMARGRERLRGRLIRRGLTPAAGLAADALHPETAPARVHEPLLNVTVRSATRTLEGSATPLLVSGSAVSLKEGVLQAMIWSQWRTAGLVGSAVAALVVGVGTALAYQEVKEGGRSAPPQEPARPVVSPPVAAQPADSSAAVIVPLPPRGELHQLLRRAAGEAVALAKTKPEPSDWTLTTIATAQAKAGDLDGARATFADAAREAEGGFGGDPYARGLWRVGHFQAESGFKEEAGATLRRAVKALPGVAGDYDKDRWTLGTFAVIVQEQAGSGARQDARRTADRLLEFSKAFLASTEIGNARDVSAPTVASALAAVGDFEAAFGWAKGVQNDGNVLGEIAGAASKTLDREAARRFVREAADRLAKMETVDQTYFGLGDLAEAQARLGDVEAAKRSATAIGEGPSRGDFDMTDGQPYALLRVASVQRQAGDAAGARETLCEGFRSVRDHPLMRGRDGRYGQIASAQLANGDIDGAIRSVEAMEGKRSESLAYIARAQAAAGEHNAARATFARALGDAGLLVKDPPPPNPELAKSPGVSQNMPASARMNLAGIQATAGDVPGALKTLRSIDDQNYQRFALERVVSARASAGDVAGALRLGLSEAKTPDERRSALAGLGRGVDTRLSLKTLDPRGE